MVNAVRYVFIGYLRRTSHFLLLAVASCFRTFRVSLVYILRTMSRYLAFSWCTYKLLMVIQFRKLVHISDNGGTERDEQQQSLLITC